MKYQRKIYIRGQVYFLPDEKVAPIGASGTVYRLDTGDEDLAVKIYHSEPILDDDEIYYPTIGDLNYFIDFSPEVLPILLSKYAVEDEDHQYVGCATDFITETRGSTTDALFTLPKDIIFNYLHQLWDTIPTLDAWGISSSDWSLSNIMLGKSRRLPEGIYLFDDSNYEVSREHTDNIWEANFLIEEIVEEYCSSRFDEEIYRRILSRVSQQDNPLAYLERQCKNHKTIGSSLDQQAKILQKKYY